MEQITFLTYGDVIESGACLDGVISACKENENIFFGEVDELLKAGFDKDRILVTAKLNGDGDGNGYGN